MKTETATFTDLSKMLGRCVSVADSPCIGLCTVTQWGDDRCKGCGRTQTEIRDWGTFSETEKKIINLRNASENYDIRHLKRGVKDEIQERHADTST